MKNFFSCLNKNGQGVHLPGDCVVVVKKNEYWIFH